LSFYLFDLSLTDTEPWSRGCCKYY